MLYNLPVEQEQVYELVTLLKLHEPPFWHGVLEQGAFDDYWYLKLFQFQ